jgi:hypothetical protein
MVLAWWRDGGWTPDLRPGPNGFTSCLTPGWGLVAVVVMKKFAGIALAALALATTTGCYRTQEGRVSAGVPFAKDTIESRYERPASQLFEAAKAALAYNGTPTSEDVVRKTLAAKVNNRSVFIKVEELEPNISRIFVQARKSGGRGDIILASELDKQIALRLR